MKLLNEKEWMVRWALMGEPAEIPMEMLVQTPLAALRKQLTESRRSTVTGSKTLYTFKGTPLRSPGRKRGGVFRIWLRLPSQRNTQNARPYCASFPSKPKRRLGYYKHLENALKCLHQEAKRLRYV